MNLKRTTFSPSLYHGVEDAVWPCYRIGFIAVHRVAGDSKYWCISHAQSGRKIAGGFATKWSRAAAIAAAQEIIDLWNGLMPEFPHDAPRGEVQSRIDNMPELYKSTIMHLVFRLQRNSGKPVTA